MGQSETPDRSRNILHSKNQKNFTITLDGERVVDVDIRIGYTHRGIEKLMESRTYTQNLYLLNVSAAFVPTPM